MREGALELMVREGVGLATLPDPAWLVPILGGLGAGIAFVTARINRQTALVARERLHAEAALIARTERPEAVLLPARLARFVDRGDLLEEAMAAIRAGDRVLAIEGGAGVGKSAVASELVHRLRNPETVDAPNLHAYDFVWLDGREHPLTLSEICQQITLLTGDQSLSAVAEHAKLGALRAHLARRKTVLLLDNVSPSRDPEGDAVQQLLRMVPSGSLVIASLNGAHGLEAATRVLVEELAAADVRDLVDQQSRRLGLAGWGLFDDAFATRLQGIVGGNPRLIESFLRAVVASPSSIEELLDGLERGEGLGELFVPAWDDLAPDARRVLSACAFLRGQAVVEQLAVASDVDLPVVSTALSELMRVGLVSVVRGVGRPEVIVCSPAVQRFVLAELSDDVIATFTARLTDYYVLEFAAHPEDAEWAVPHIPGIKAVLQWGSDRGDDVRVQALFVSALDVLFTLGLFDDRVALGRLAYESATAAGNYRAASLATDVLSSTHAARGDLDQAREALALGLIAAEQSDDPAERARQMRAHGLVLYKSGDAAGAVRAMRDADGLARQTGDLEILVNVQGLRTVAHWYLGDVAEAEAAALAGMQVCEEMSWERAMAYPLRNLAELAIFRGELERARALLERARAVVETFGDRRQTMRVELTGARLALAARDAARAHREATLAEADARSLGLVPELAEAAALRRTAARTRLLPVLGRYYAARRRLRFTDAPVGGD